MKALEEFGLIPDETATIAYTFKEIPKGELESVELVTKVRKKNGKFLFILQKQGDNYGYALERILRAIDFCMMREDLFLQLEDFYQWYENKTGERLLVIGATIVGGGGENVYLIVCPLSKADGEEWI